MDFNPFPSSKIASLGNSPKSKYPKGFLTPLQSLLFSAFLDRRKIHVHFINVNLPNFLIISYDHEDMQFEKYDKIVLLN